MKDTSEYSWINISQAAFHVDVGCTHRPDKRRHDSKKAQSNKRTSTESEEKAGGRRRNNKSKEFFESLKKAVSDPFILEIEGNQVLQVALNFTYQVYSINSGKTYSVKVSKAPQCTCSYFTSLKRNRKQIYKHLLWVYFNIFQQPQESHILQQVSLSLHCCYQT